MAKRKQAGRSGAPETPGGRGRGRLRLQQIGRPAALAQRPGASSGSRAYWIYGRHAVVAALRNPRRRLLRLIVTPEAEAAADLAEARARLGDRLALSRADRQGFADVLGPEAVHQGIAVEVLPLPEVPLDTILGSTGPEAAILVLDRVTDPHNVGAILRSAAAFGVAAVIHTQHHAPAESGSLAKAASGGLEQVPIVRVANLGQALEALKQHGFWCLGLAADGPESLTSVDLGGRLAFVLGAEGAGLRRLTREHCDLLVRLPTAPGLVQLNVSNAAAIALYERARALSSEPKPV